ncbi:ATPase V0 complex c/d subunit [Arabidopsis suecica]|uniref:ATPase V0 complex c/d subunit n=1 Tax=Arabidopsis suecica TaxID=45249 RepID=A0A8T2BML0_ARASU|nr:ATPase V0 complex c/d subunit [Arabidopsis suecica]
MIDNVVLIVTGTLHERDVQKLLEKCHPLGMFDSIDTLVVAQNMRELYRLVLVDNLVQQSCRIRIFTSSDVTIVVLLYF